MNISISLATPLETSPTPPSFEGLLVHRDTGEIFDSRVIVTLYEINKKSLKTIQSKLLKNCFAASLLTDMVGYVEYLEDEIKPLTAIAYLECTDRVVTELYQSIRRDPNRYTDIVQDGFVKSLFFAIWSTQKPNAMAISEDGSTLTFNPNTRTPVYLLCKYLADTE